MICKSESATTRRSCLDKLPKLFKVMKDVVVLMFVRGLIQLLPTGKRTVQGLRPNIEEVIVAGLSFCVLTC